MPSGTCIYMLQWRRKQFKSAQAMGVVQKGPGICVADVSINLTIINNLTINVIITVS